MKCQASADPKKPCRRKAIARIRYSNAVATQDFALCLRDLIGWVGATNPDKRVEAL